MFDKSVLWVVSSSIVMSFVNSTTLTSLDEALASSLTAVNEKVSLNGLIFDGSDVAVLPLGSCTTATMSKDTSPL